VRFSFRFPKALAQLIENLNKLMASKSCTPAETLVDVEQHVGFYGDGSRITRTPPAVDDQVTSSPDERNDIRDSVRRKSPACRFR
jgi:hypothetical protein